MITLVLRWPFDDALDMLAFRCILWLQSQPVSLAPAPPDVRSSRMQLHTSWRLGYAKTKMGMLRAIEMRLQDLEEQVGSVGSRLIA